MKKLINIMSFVMVISLIITTVVFADNVVNDVTVGGTDTFTLGESTTVGYKIVATSGDGQAGCNASDGSAATVTINVPAGVTATPSSLIFTTCNDFIDVVFTASVAGNYIITVSVSDSGTGTYSVVPATFTLKVLPSATTDTTPPVISYELNPETPDGSDDWYVGDVTVKWTVTDDESTITSSTGCDDTTIDYDTAGKTLTCEATSTGGTSSESVTIKRDATKPLIKAELDKNPAASGWFNIATGAPTVKFTCSDATSGIATCPDDHTFVEGVDQSYSGTAYDYAGNSESAGVSDVDVDLTAPGITWVGGPVDGAEYYFGFVPAAPTCGAIDTLSRSGDCIVTGYGTSVGTHTLTATAHDLAGNESVETRSYTVLPWDLFGFYQPVDMNGVWNTVKGGSTVPLKFKVFAETELTDTAVVKSLIATAVACPVNGYIADAIETVATGGTSLRYDWTAEQFIFNWQTPKKPGACYTITMTTQDGSFLTANFKLK